MTDLNLMVVNTFLLSKVRLENALEYDLIRSCACLFHSNFSFFSKFVTEKVICKNSFLELLGIKKICLTRLQKLTANRKGRVKKMHGRNDYVI